MFKVDRGPVGHQEESWQAWSGEVTLKNMMLLPSEMKKSYCHWWQREPMTANHSSLHLPSSRVSLSDSVNISHMQLIVLVDCLLLVLPYKVLMVSPPEFFFTVWLGAPLAHLWCTQWKGTKGSRWLVQQSLEVEKVAGAREAMEMMETMAVMEMRRKAHFSCYFSW